MAIQKVCVIGLGHLGSIHARIYSELASCRLIGVCDIDTQRAEAIARKFKTAAFRDYHPLLDACDCASIVVPTPLHYNIARDFISAGKAVLIEKPITAALADADELLEKAQRNNVVLQVGHIERYNSAFQAVQALAQDVRFIECHRMGPFSERGADVGVVLDLMIHDIDIILGLIKSEVKGIEAIGVPVLTKYEDIANARLKFENGAVANLNASRITDKKMRKIRIFQRDTYISLDYIKQEAALYRKVEGPTTKKESIRYRITRQIIKTKREEPLKKELAAFLECVRTKERPIVSGVEARNALEIAIRITNQINA